MVKDRNTLPRQLSLFTVICYRKLNRTVIWYKVWSKRKTFFWLPKLFEAIGPAWIPSTNFRHKPTSMSTAKKQKEHHIWWKEMEEWFPASNNNCLTINKPLCAPTLHFFIYKSRDTIPAYYLSGLLWSSKESMSVKYFSLLVFKL